MLVFLALHARQPVIGDSQNQNMNLSKPVMGHFNLNERMLKLLENVMAFAVVDGCLWLFSL